MSVHVDSIITNIKKVKWKGVMEMLLIRYLVAFLCGALIWPILRSLARRRSRQHTIPSKSSTTIRSHIYGLEHAILNLYLPSTSMWMNLGYWKEQIRDPKDFPGACQALLERVLLTALPLQQESKETATGIHLLDVGYGCGDQTMFLLGAKQLGSQNSQQKEYYDTPRVVKYVGITNDSTQYSYACDRLDSLGLLRSSPAAMTGKSEAALYCEDAAQPSLWTARLTDEVNHLYDPSPFACVWLLALDTMYHFAPSRLPLLHHARKELHASFMAFDLLLADKEKAPNFKQRLILKLFCMLTSTPYSNLLTCDQYQDLLVKAGYEREMIEIEDVTEHVFGPLSLFMARQEAFLQAMGQGIGAFRAAKWVFRWWARTGIVRGCIIVARKTP